jgi:hypothetical protein
MAGSGSSRSCLRPCPSSSAPNTWENVRHLGGKVTLAKRVCGDFIETRRRTFDRPSYRAHSPLSAYRASIYAPPRRSRRQKTLAIFVKPSVVGSTRADWGPLEEGPGRRAERPGSAISFQLEITLGPGLASRGRTSNMAGQSQKISTVAYWSLASGAFLEPFRPSSPYCVAGPSPPGPNRPPTPKCPLPGT